MANATKTEMEKLIKALYDRCVDIPDRVDLTHGKYHATTLVLQPRGFIDNAEAYNAYSKLFPKLMGAAREDEKISYFTGTRSVECTKEESAEMAIWDALWKKPPEEVKFSAYPNGGSYRCNRPYFLVLKKPQDCLNELREIEDGFEKHEFMIPVNIYFVEVRAPENLGDLHKDTLLLIVLEQDDLPSEDRQIPGFKRIYGTIPENRVLVDGKMRKMAVYYNTELADEGDIPPGEPICF